MKLSKRQREVLEKLWDGQTIRARADILNKKVRYTVGFFQETVHYNTYLALYHKGYIYRYDDSVFAITEQGRKALAGQ